MKISLLALIVAAQLVASAATAAVGFTKVTIPDASGQPIEAGIWYPTEAAPQPTRIELFTQDVAHDAPPEGHGLGLVVISHGHGGSFASHADTAYALAEAGFVAASLTHNGDNYRDQSRSIQVSDRPRQVKLLVDYMTAAWPGHAIDPARIGAFGFSAGGFTVLAAAGGQPDFALIRPHCGEHPDFYDCKLVAQHGGLTADPPPQQSSIVNDSRIRAIVVAAPALGFTFVHGLAAVTMPVQLWRADDDHILPPPYYADAVRGALPNPPDFHAVSGAGHFDFLAPCSEALRQVVPDICASAPGFDRAAFHADFNRAVVAFFEKALK